MEEIIFIVSDAPEGGFTARALGHSIFAEADSVEQLHEQIKDAVRCHFDENKTPKIIRLHFSVPILHLSRWFFSKFVQICFDQNQLHFFLNDR